MWDYFEDMDEYLYRRKPIVGEYNKFDSYIPYLKPDCLEGCIIKEISVQDKKGKPFFSQRPIIEEEKEKEKIKDKIKKTKKYVIAKIRPR